MKNHVLDIEAIRQLLPHRYPMLLVDRIIEWQPGERVVGLKNVTINESFFNGHFPEKAVMPGVLILESMAQVACLIMLLAPEHRHKLPYLGGIDRCRLRRPVVPGDTLIIEATLLKVHGDAGKVQMIARVDEQEVASCEMLFKLVENNPTPVTVEAGDKNSV